MLTSKPTLLAHFAVIVACNCTLFSVPCLSFFPPSSRAMSSAKSRSNIEVSGRLADSLSWVVKPPEPIVAVYSFSAFLNT